MAQGRPSNGAADLCKARGARMCTWLGRPVGKGDQVAGCLRAVPLLWCVQVQLLQQERSSEATTANPDQEAAIEAAIRAETDFLMQVRLQGWWWFAYGLCSGAVVAGRAGGAQLTCRQQPTGAAQQCRLCRVQSAGMLTVRGPPCRGCGGGGWPVALMVLQSSRLLMSKPSHFVLAIALPPKPAGAGCCQAGAGTGEGAAADHSAAVVQGPGEHEAAAHGDGYCSQLMQLSRGTRVKWGMNWLYML